MAHTVHFGPFELDIATAKLTRAGEPIALGGRAMAVLVALAESGRTLKKDEILDRAWPDVHVEEANLSVQIAGLRKLLGESSITTVPRVGYRLNIDSRAPAAPGLPLIAVLPFRPKGPGDQPDYFADGVAEDLISALGRFRQFAVLSRRAAVAGQDRLPDIGVRYLVGGTIWTANDSLRISAHLESVGDGRQLWSRRFDRTPEKLFEVQDEIVEAVAGALVPEIEAAEIERVRRLKPENLDAYDLFLRALPELYSETEAGNARARDMLDRALALEPENPLYLAHAAWALEHRSSMGWPLFDDDHRDRCIRFARAALSHRNADARTICHAALSLLHMADYDMCKPAIERALRENPNSSLVHLSAAVIALHIGELEAIPDLVSRFEELAPEDPLRHIGISLRAAYFVLTERPELAISEAVKGIAMQPNFDPLYWMIIKAQVDLGQLAEAARYVEKLRAVSPDATVSTIRQGQPSLFPERIEPILAALEAAGLPLA